MGIASSILEAVSKEALRYPGQRAAKVGVVIGEYAGVDTESLRFCFETLANGLELDITWRTGSDDLRLAYLELEEGSDEQGCNRNESSERQRSSCRAPA
jgi:Zn finger protein HypA/HybF involved in hydrogenase expression